MKIFKVRYLIAFSTLLATLSCNTKKFLNLKPLNQFSESDVWSDPNLIQLYVNRMYAANFGMPLADRQLSDYSDESRSTWSTTYNFNKSLYSSDTYAEWEGGFGPEGTIFLRWAPLYQNVRRENIFFNNISLVQAKTESDKSLVQRLKGEAYFNRGLSYHLLVALYGGVPIITKPYSLNDSFSVARNSYKECIEFIVKQLDSAALLLPETYPADLAGHATKGAALALKSRVLLYAASDLHNPQKNNVVTKGYSHPELLGYTQGDPATRWEAAKDAAKAVMDLGMYSLYKSDPAPTDNIAQNFKQYFTSRGGDNDEDIMLQFFPTVPMGGYNGAEAWDPNGYNCWGNQTPLEELVEDYEMKDGSKFSWSNSDEAAYPFKSREPRFYSTIIYEGMKYRQRPDGYEAYDRFNRIQLGRIYNKNGDLLVGGIDTRDGPINTANGGYTGYYNRKFTDTTVDAQFFFQDVPFRQFRYGEIILNYAEACVELGEDNEARLYIDKIRHRAGLPDLSNTLAGNALLDAYRHERRIEMAFEGQRFWDIRRWLIAGSVTHQTHALDIRYIVDNNVTSYRKDDGSTWALPTYKVVETPGDLRIWKDRDYFFPIKRDEMHKNGKLIQNPGYQ